MSLIIFDWDDTLFPTSYLDGRNIGLRSTPAQISEWQAYLLPFATMVNSLLTTALRHGTVRIITNSENGWVQQACKEFMPSLLPTLDLISVISAASIYCKLFPDTPYAWKLYTFTIAISGWEGGVISVGDSPIERSVTQLITTAQNIPCKIVTFAPRSHIRDLHWQVETVFKELPKMVEHSGNLDLQLAPTTECSSPVTFQ
jgi:hypothetical protein